MTFRWQLRLYDNGRLYVAELSGPASIGRQRNSEETQPSHTRVGGGWRVVIAPLEDLTISRDHLDIEPLADGRFLLCNRSAKLLVGLPDNGDLEPGATCKVRLPVVLHVGQKMLSLQPSADEQ